MPQQNGVTCETRFDAFFAYVRKKRASEQQKQVFFVSKCVRGSNTLPTTLKCFSPLPPSLSSSYLLPFDSRLNLRTKWCWYGEAQLNSVRSWGLLQQRGQSTALLALDNTSAKKKKKYFKQKKNLKKCRPSFQFWCCICS